MAVDSGVPDGWEVVTPTAAPQEEKTHHNNVGGMTAATARDAWPILTDAVEAFGTSPTAAKTFGNAARVGTTVGGVLGGAMSGSPAQVLAASKEGWLAGRGGYFLAKGAQSAARPIATAMEKAGPLVDAVSAPLSIVQGALDLTQMAEPNRNDIGFMGVGKTAEPKGPVIDAAKLTAEERAQVGKLSGWDWAKFRNLVMKDGMTEKTALHQVLSK